MHEHNMHIHVTKGRRMSPLRYDRIDGNYSAFQTFRQSAFRKRNENTEYFTYIQYDFQKDKPKTISENIQKMSKSSRLSNLMRLKVNAHL